MATEETISAKALLARVLDELDRLPVQEHLAALEALNRHDLELVLTDDRSITVILGDCTVVLPLDDIIVPPRP